MRNVAARPTAQSLLFALLVLGLSVPAMPSPAGAQPRPAIGLNARGAQLLGEEVGEQSAPATADRFGSSLAAGDFNQDGADDLAVGIPYDDCVSSGDADCGSVVVRWGVLQLGLGAQTTRLSQGTGATPDPPRAGDQYGWALAAGDFDGNGRDDLAVGVPGDRHSSGTYPVGAVQLHWGAQAGSGRLFEPSVAGWEEAWAYARFGHAVAFGDFNGDGFDDLAVGAPNDGCYPPACPFILRNVGSVRVFDGNNTGATLSFDMVLGIEGLPDVAERDEQFGYALAAGDFNGDGFDDLAVGVPSEDDVGAVLVVYGSPWSLLFAHHEYFSQWDLNQTTQAGERFAESLAAGDFDGDGFDDLAIGIPSFDGDTQLTDMGLSVTVYGSGNGLFASGRFHFLWEHLLFGGGASAFDGFAAALAAGDFDGDGVDDLALGIRRDQANKGGVAVVMGRSQEGLTGARRRLYPRDYPRGMIPDEQTGFALYGSSVAAGDFDGNGFDDLAIGAPGRQQIVGPQAFWEAGAAAVVYGQLFADGFEANDAFEWSSVAH